MPIWVVTIKCPQISHILGSKIIDHIHKDALTMLSKRGTRKRTLSALSHDSLSSITIVAEPIQSDDVSIKSDDVTVAAADGGWGWVVVTAAFVECSLLGFMFASFNVFYVSLVEHFDSDRGETGWIGSLFAFSGNFLGILIGASCKRYGAKAVGMTGCLLTSLGILLSALLVNIPYLYVTYGIIAGVGQGTVAISTLVIVPQYFAKRRPLAIGLAVTGFSLGTIISAPISVALIEEFGLSGAYVLSSGIFLHTAIGISCYRSVEFNNKIRKYSSTVGLTRTTNAQENANGTALQNDSACNTPKYNCRSVSQNGNCADNRSTDETLSTPLQLSIPDINPKANSRLEQKHSVERTAKLGEDHGQVDDIESPDESQALEKHKTSIDNKHKSVFSDLLNFSVLKNLEYDVFLVVTFACSFGFMAFFVHFISRAVYLDIDRDKVIFMQTLMGVFTATGRCIITFLATSRRVQRDLLFGVLIIAMAIVEISFPAACTFIPLLIYACCHGLLGGALGSLQLIVLAAIGPVEHISKVTGIYSMSIATATLIAIPLAGFIFDVSQSYDLPFYVAGSVTLIGGVIMVALAGHRKRSRRRGKH